MDTVKNFAFGGMAGTGATLCVHPLDVIRVQMQIDKGKGAGMVGTAKRIAAADGVGGLYAGLSAGVFRQLTYGLTRFGVYTTLMDKYSEKDKPMGFGQKLLFGSMAGGIGACAGNPSEVALVRMSADKSLPVEDRRGYKNVVDALVRVTKEEGIATLWRGVGPTITRCMVLNAAQLGTFSQAKETLRERGFEEGPKLHFSASLVSGFCATVVTLPLDTTKTRIQNMKSTLVDGVMVPEYKSAMDCIMKTVRNEGPLGLWKGFGAFYIKLAPHTTISLILLETIRKKFSNK